MTDENLLARAAFLEFQVASAYSTGQIFEAEPRVSRRRAPDALRPYLSTFSPPRWFVQEELGYALDRGPSLSWTLRVLAVQNARALKALGHDAPARVTYPKRKR